MAPFKHEDYRKLNDEHRQWLSQLNFIQDEIKHFQNQVAELKATFEKQDVHKKLDEFKKEFLSYISSIDQFRQDIYAHERHLAKTMDLATRSNVEIEEDHHTEKEKIEEFFNNFQKLKDNFKDYAALIKDM